MGDREEINQYKQQIEYERLTELWEYFTAHEKAMAGFQKHLCMPPAFQAFLRDRTADMQEAVRESATTAGEAVAHYVKQCGILMPMLFNFGSLCAQRTPPLLYDELTECNCGNLSDEDVELLLKGE